MSHSCKKCKNQRKKVSISGSSWLSALLIIVIPKCPFCIMAYSSAITMCGGPAVYWQDSNWVSYIPVFLAVFIIAMLIINYRDARTKYAITIATIGLLLVVLAHQVIIDKNFYYYGTCLLMISIWLNGSLFSVLQKLKEKSLSRFKLILGDNS